jgi:hypothetical protein
MNFTGIAWKSAHASYGFAGNQRTSPDRGVITKILAVDRLDPLARIQRR